MVRGTRDCLNLGAVGSVLVWWDPGGQETRRRRGAGSVGDRVADVLGYRPGMSVSIWRSKPSCRLLQPAVVAITLVGVTTAGCDSATPEVETLKLDCGLALQVPERSIREVGVCSVGLQEGAHPTLEHRAELEAAKEGPEADRLAGWYLGPRAPWSIDLDVWPSRPDLGCWPMPRVVSMSVVGWTCGLEESAGGSSGTDYDRTGWVRLKAGMYLRFRFHDQEEWPDDPAEHILWAVLGSVEVESVP